MDTFGAIFIVFIAAIVMMIGAAIEQSTKNRELAQGGSSGRREHA